MNILMAASECSPFAKTGGLADVVGSLPIYLAKMGHDVRVVMPKYGFINFKDYQLKKEIPMLNVWMGNKEEWACVYSTDVKGVKIYFVEFNLYFERNGIYHDSAFNDYEDNPKRFAFLCRAALEICKAINFKPDVLHSHDWQTALLSAYAKVWHWNDPFFYKSVNILTIHNIAYQGIYPKYHYPYLGFGEEFFVPDIFECFGSINFLKAGIFFADYVTTVSPKYASETKEPFGGFGLAPYLNAKKDKYIGILNGVDYDVWDPAKDPFIPANYSIEDLKGKSICKKELQKRMGLEQNKDIPVIGIVSRFVEQKGLHFLLECLDDIVRNMVVQFAILGAGDKRLESFFYYLPSKYPGRVGSYIGYNEELAHLIEAGSDFFLMPSLYEPCGLNQIYSMKYGTLPIVRAVGGLDDTVENYDEATGNGTGFKFYEASSKAIYYTVGWAVSTFFDRKKHMKKLIKNAMSKDFSWDKSAKMYEELYIKALKMKNGE
ncbi:MAG: glycogen synthase GlgA [Brevinematales bacterium]|nr:glycogen synthase GlgA [Brevinematales bacterium]